MPHFAVFFSDGAGFGIEIVKALDAGHAQEIARALHRSGLLYERWAIPPAPCPERCSAAQSHGCCWLQDGLVFVSPDNSCIIMPNCSNS